MGLDLEWLPKMVEECLLLEEPVADTN